MFDYIKGEIVELSPAYVVLDVGGIGYNVQIALSVYSQLQGVSSVKLFVFEVIREDAHLLYGFISPNERQLFLLLISVSGIGANTARMIMSSYSSNEIQDMIASGNVNALNSIKGIGLKTAQRIIVDLKDKIMKISGSDFNSIDTAQLDHSHKNEAISALVMLGFSSAASQKVIDQILKKEPSLKVEQLIKLALKML